jgi:two-component system sensor histidine kinase UhpB
MVIAQRRLVTLHRSYAQRLLAAQEEERARVAREVHADAVQRLALLRHELEAFAGADQLSAAQQHRLRGIMGEVQDLTDVLRHLARQLHPAVIEQAGLLPALEQLADDMARGADLAVQLDLPAELPPLAADRTIVLFRVAQEALRNVALHAGVKEAALTLRTGADDVELVVEDQGRGFDPGAVRGDGGLGLIGIDERARLAGGSSTIAARPGHGTTVTVRIPRAVST